MPFVLWVPPFSFLLLPPSPAEETLISDIENPGRLGGGLKRQPLEFPE